LQHTVLQHIGQSSILDGSSYEIAPLGSGLIRPIASLSPAELAPRRRFAPQQSGISAADSPSGHPGAMTVACRNYEGAHRNMKSSHHG